MDKCSGCSGRLKNETPDGRVKTCTKCGGLHLDHIYKGDAYKYVKLGTLVDQQDGDPIRYFDATVIGSDGLQRIHGWFNPVTLLVVQYG